MWIGMTYGIVNGHLSFANSWHTKLYVRSDWVPLRTPYPTTGPRLASTNFDTDHGSEDDDEDAG